MTPLKLESIPDFCSQDSQIYKYAEETIINVVKSACKETENISGAEIFRQKIRARGEEIKNRIASMILMSCHAPDLSKVVKEGILEIKAMYETFSQKTLLTHKKIENFHSQIHNIKDTLNKTSFKAENFTSHLQDAVTNASVDTILKPVNHYFGKSAGIAGEVAFEVFFGHPIEGTENPTRDKIVTAGVSIGIAEVLQFGLKRTPAYMAVAGMHLLHDVSCAAEESRAIMEQQQDIKEFWNKSAQLSLEGPSFESTMLLSKALLTTTKAPGEYLQAAQDQATIAVLKFADHIGLTEKNLRDSFDPGIKPKEHFIGL